jgi:DNA-binding IclR family transcriptional regulator
MPIKSVRKALGFLDILGFEDLENKGFVLSELAGKMGIPPNTARTLLKTMVDCGYVAQDSSGRYKLGYKYLRLWELRQAVDADTRRRFLTVLEKWNQEFNELIGLLALVNGKRLLLFLLDSSHAVKATGFQEDHINPYKPTAPSGRVLVAYASAEERREIVRINGYPGKIWDDAKDDEGLERACAKIREQGGVNYSLAKEGIRTLACPVLTDEGKLLASIGSCVPLFRCNEKRGQELLAAMKKTAKEIAAVWHLP